jgi:hypothetical protein
LFFDQSSSDSDSSEDPDYKPPTPVKRIITTSDDSWPDNSSSQPLIQPSTSKQRSDQQEPSLDSDSETSKDSEPELRTVKSKSNKDSWKNTATTAWTPPRKVVIERDPESIATRTRSRHVQDVHDSMASYPHELNIDSMCCKKVDRNVQNHQVVFKHIGNHATNVHYHHVRIPVNLSKILETPTVAMQHMRTYVKEVNQQSLMY